MVLGGKGASLCEMAKLTLPVLPAFIITTEASLEYFTEGTENLPATLDHEYALKTLEGDTGTTFGDPNNRSSCPCARAPRPQCPVYTNADTLQQAAQTRKLGTQGIGLYRSEHMFFEPEKISSMRAMIVADN